MSDLLILAGIGVAGVLLLFILHTNPAVAFCALIIGGILQRVLQNESMNVVRSFLPSGKLPADSIAGFAMLLTPVFIAMMLSRKRGHAKHKLPGYIILLCFGAALVHHVMSVLPPSTVHGFVESGAYTHAEPYLVIAMAIGGILSVMLFANSLPKHDARHKGKHH